MRTPEPTRGAESDPAPRIVLFAGAGAVKRSWEPIRRAMRRTFPALRTAENADFAVAHLVYQLRLACSQAKAGGAHMARQRTLHEQLERVRRDIASELLRAQTSGELRTHAAFEKVVQRFALVDGGSLTLVTTNWDEVVDRRVTELCSPSHAQRLSIHHLHGRLTEPDSLYLPSEMRCEPYRDERKIEDLEALHAQAMQRLQHADRMIVYGLSLSPLDVELAFALGEVCRLGSLSAIHVVDRDVCAVAERLAITLGRSDLPPIHCFTPDDLEHGWLFPEGCDQSARPAHERTSSGG
jgi:hypothetical protein